MASSPTGLTWKFNDSELELLWRRPPAHQRTDHSQGHEQQRDLDVVDDAVAGRWPRKRDAETSVQRKLRHHIANGAAAGDRETRRRGLHGAPSAERQSALAVADQRHRGRE